MFGCGDFKGFFRCGRRDDHFNKLAGNNGLCRLGIKFAVERDNAAECGGWIGFVSPVVGFKDRCADGNATRIGMFHDDACRLAELFHTLQRRVGISDVVIRERFALNLLSGRDGRLFNFFFYIEGCVLVAVFAVTHILLLNEVQIESTRETTRRFVAVAVIGWNQATKIVSDHAVVSGGVFKRFDGEVETGRQ
ncbi:hypothetical protein D3C80_1052630 [compost metagenome]